MDRHIQVGAGGLQNQPFDVDQLEPGVRDCYRVNRPVILENHREGPVESIYNVPLCPGFSMHDLHQTLKEIYDRQTHAFKINFSFGMILMHTETGRYRYFKPYDNESVLEEPVLVSQTPRRKWNGPIATSPSASAYAPTFRGTITL